MEMLSKLSGWWAGQSAVDLMWLSVGITGQLLFSARWILQWLASEKTKKSIVPQTFWYLSFLGSLLVLAYGIYKAEPVIIAGQFGLIVYARNLFFIRRDRQMMAVPADPPAAA